MHGVTERVGKEFFKMDRAGSRGPIKQSSATGAPETAESSGRLDGPRIEMGMGRRRVTGHDLFLYHALVSRNDQTFNDLSQLHPNDAEQMAVYTKQVRPKFVTESWLERVNLQFTGWMRSRWSRISHWMLRRQLPLATAKVKDAGRERNDRRPQKSPSKRAA
jgi:hypothetical protein